MEILYLKIPMLGALFLEQRQGSMASPFVAYEKLKNREVMFCMGSICGVYAPSDLIKQ